MSLRLVMMGTGEFAVPTLRALYDTPHPVLALFTQPDRGGAQRRHAHPMKELALERKTPVFQPEKINTPESLAALRELGADLFVVAAYGQILSDDLLRIPPRGSINVHASLLPKYRGAAPVNYAILKGERETGVSIIEVQSKLDAGPVLALQSTPIGSRETAGELEMRLAAVGAELTCRVLDQIAIGSEVRVPQDDRQATFAPKMKKELGAIDWSRRAEEVDWHLRAMQPWPTPFTFLHQPGKPPRRLVVRAVEAGQGESSAEPGTVLLADKLRLVVQTGSVPVEIVQLQPEGKRAMSAAEFLRGYPVSAGDRFGP